VRRSAATRPTRCSGACTLTLPLLPGRNGLPREPLRRSSCLEGRQRRDPWSRRSHCTAAGRPDDGCRRCRSNHPGAVLPGTAGAEPANPNSHRMVDATRLERRLDRAVARATTPRGAAIVIATVSTVMTVGAGTVMTVLDHENYPSVGSGLWWAVQTVTTVGYGDNVPMTLAGRLVAALVMLLGIGLLTVITAAITSTFVSRSRREQAPADAETALAEQFRQLDSRLERIEAALGRSSSP
jgi:voltage-gated potassium channel